MVLAQNSGLEWLAGGGIFAVVGIILCAIAYVLVMFLVLAFWGYALSWGWHLAKRGFDDRP